VQHTGSRPRHLTTDQSTFPRLLFFSSSHLYNRD
jgi:hypothetical protein